MLDIIKLVQDQGLPCSIQKRFTRLLFGKKYHSTMLDIIKLVQDQGLPSKTFFRSSAQDKIRSIVAQRAASEVRKEHRSNSSENPGAPTPEFFWVFRKQYHSERLSDATLL